MKKIVQKILLFLYIVFIYFGIVFKFGASYVIYSIKDPQTTFIERVHSIVFIPFINFIQDIQTGGISVFLKFALGNIVIFIPLGFLLSMILQKNHFKMTLLISFLISLSCEILQLILGVGVCDINDLIFNTLGGIIGHLLFIFINSKKIQQNSN